MPATWPPGSYHDRTFTGEQTMAFQDAPRYVSPLLYDMFAVEEPAP
ncbi:MAG: hypothetical protein MUO64_07780 [Anaerolineales bacterium]|nr:hypothetical protein [Anaerolineales bacterium]